MAPRRRIRSRVVRRAAALATGAWAAAAAAGPPYVTDDPEPTDLGHWEIYVFGAGSGQHRDLESEGGIDLNYGGFKDVQLTATLPVALTHQGGRGTRVGPGDVELGVKYRFIKAERGGFEAAIFPRVILPTGGHRFGTGRVRLLLPLWAQKDFDRWSLFGGAGYTINPGAGNRDFWQSGLALTRSLSERTSLGGEAWIEGADAVGGHRTIGLGLGGIHKLGGPFALLVSGGPTWEHRGARGWRGYAALGLSF
ncbi:MAG: hypothetical protein QOK17_1520 [Sphingomonadales bacterium]|jgi:hypothetical protein|nr:hypothetical protein [Sphingomonadales bacterium]